MWSCQQILSVVIMRESIHIFYLFLLCVQCDRKIVLTDDREDTSIMAILIFMVVCQFRSEKCLQQQSFVLLNRIQRSSSSTVWTSRFLCSVCFHQTQVLLKHDREYPHSLLLYIPQLNSWFDWFIGTCIEKGCIINYYIVLQALPAKSKILSLFLDCCFRYHTRYNFFGTCLVWSVDHSQ